MPCRCDDYYETPRVAPGESEHEKRCHAQSLVNKLACILEKNGIKVSSKIAKNIKAAREDLAKHKREEFLKDNKAEIKLLQDLNYKILQIEKFGGIVPNGMKLDQQNQELKVNKINSISDSELLGDETT